MIQTNLCGPTWQWHYLQMLDVKKIPPQVTVSNFAHTSSSRQSNSNQLFGILFAYFSVCQKFLGFG